MSLPDSKACAWNHSEKHAAVCRPLAVLSHLIRLPFLPGNSVRRHAFPLSQTKVRGTSEWSTFTYSILWGSVGRREGRLTPSVPQQRYWLQHGWLQSNKNCGYDFPDFQLSASLVAISVDGLHFPQKSWTPHSNLKGTKIYKKSICKVLKRLKDGKWQALRIICGCLYSQVNPGLAISTLSIFPTNKPTCAWFKSELWVNPSARYLLLPHDNTT